MLDAGAGIGLMQWWLAHQQIDVISVDRRPRYFSRKLRSWCPILAYGNEPNPFSVTELGRYLLAAIRDRSQAVRQLGITALTLRDSILGSTPPQSSGAVRVITGNLLDLSCVESESLDAIVSISSLEHNSPTQLPQVISELMRVLRPGGRLIATLGASKDKDWYHEPSAGWCYTDATLRNVFGLDNAAPSNYQDYDDLFTELRSCTYLRDNLSDFYYRSQKNGMPLGVWDPKYQSVGVVKTKGP